MSQPTQVKSSQVFVYSDTNAEGFTRS